jgi:hypothetical protein
MKNVKKALKIDPELESSQKLLEELKASAK